ncbi:hypothetical protein DL96DRAFT_1617782 [Flagelloscypha sp. PMI_526]|nr:hypothetical protein DL96DRAFT_1617782 [Flagelloscypha sp. PMI_526]
MSSTDMLTVTDIISRVLGGVLIFSGIMFNINPVEGARSFGITDADAQTARFFPASAARNVTIGIHVLSLSLLGQKKALGMLWLAGTIPALVDARICWYHGKKWLQHFVIGGLLGALGIVMLQES